LQSDASSQPASQISDVWFEVAFRNLLNAFDPEQGGFTSAPKFPRASVFDFLFRYWLSSGEERGLDMALFTLEKMADGGMYDHLGGGFHRYSVDARWHVPHFEKMLYDQAQLAWNYLAAFQISGRIRFREIVDGILDYVLRDLTSLTGGFYSAEDADSLPAADALEKREGAFYVWTENEIQEHLTAAEALVFARTFGVESGGNTSPENDPHGELRGQNVLIRTNDPDVVAKLTGLKEDEVRRLLESARRKLLSVRSQRPRPHLDDKILTGWNGLMISALARAFQVLEDQRYLMAAQNAARFLRANLYPKPLLRSFREVAGRTQAFAEDYAFLIQGLLDLYEADFDDAWLRWANELQAEMDAAFSDPNGGYYSTREGAADILYRMRDDHDGAEPAADSVAAGNLLRLSLILDQPDLMERATRLIKSHAQTLERSPTALPALLSAALGLISDPLQIVVVTPKLSEEPLVRTIRQYFLPAKIVLGLSVDRRPETCGEWLRREVPALAAFGLIDNHAAAYICRHFACELPVTDVAELTTKLVAEQRRPGNPSSDAHA
jgi:uncharacterized protein YyaL (SSP411 family)